MESEEMEGVDRLHIPLRQRKDSGVLVLGEIGELATEFGQSRCRFLSEFR